MGQCDVTPAHALDAHRVLEQLQFDWENDTGVQLAIVGGLEEMEAGSSGVMSLLDRMVAEKHPA